MSLPTCNDINCSIPLDKSRDSASSSLNIHFPALLSRIPSSNKYNNVCVVNNGIPSVLSTINEVNLSLFSTSGKFLSMIEPISSSLKGERERTVVISDSSFISSGSFSVVINIIIGWKRIVFAFCLKINIRSL